MTTTTEDPEVIDPKTRDEFVDRCVEGVLDLMNAKDRFELDDTSEVFAYQVDHAAHDLVTKDPELRRELAQVCDPSVNYPYTAELLRKGVPNNPSDLLKRTELTLATDVALTYAMESQTVRELEAERDALSERINP